LRLEATTFGHERSTRMFLEDQMLAEKMSLLQTPLKAAQGEFI